MRVKIVERERKLVKASSKNNIIFKKISRKSLKNFLKKFPQLTFNIRK
jgi:hypothetical protein